MSIEIRGTTNILKDDRGVYKIALMSKEVKQNGEKENKFWRVTTSFPKGVELKNKTKIEIKNGFLTFFRIKSGKTNSKGEEIFISFPKIVILDFEVLSEGVEENFSYNNQENNDMQALETENIESYEMGSDELPF